MRLSSYLHKKLVELLEDKRIVVWYDATGDFKEFVKGFEAAKCAVISCVDSALRARRQADGAYRLMNESGKHEEANQNLLIYCPRPRGAGEEAKQRDLFEVFASAGAAFGDTEDQKLESLARQAMPEMVAEVTRLFEEGKPDICLLDGLEEGNRYPLLHEALGTETPAEVIALALCDDSKAASVDKMPGCTLELLRLLDSSIGFKPPERHGGWETFRERAAAYVLYSEFAYGLDVVPGELAAVPCAGPESVETIQLACDRMRSDLVLQGKYIDIASRVEKHLRLPEIMGGDFLPAGRDTFPFEERRLLQWAAAYAADENLDGASFLIKDRKNSVWRRDPQRATDWTAMERAVALMVTAKRIKEGLDDNVPTPEEMVKAYVADWSLLDREQRLFENAFTACVGHEVLSEVAIQCRNSYRDVVLQIQERFLTAVKRHGWPPEGVLRQTRIFDEYVTPAMEQREKTAFFLVDSLRFEMGEDLGDTLADAGEIKLDCAAGVVPTVTDFGMAALLPGVDGMLCWLEKEDKLVPALGSRLLANSSDRMKLLEDTYGDRVLDLTLDDLLGNFHKHEEKMKAVDLLVVRTQDPDQIAENLGGWRARKHLSDIVGDIAAVVKRLVSVGYSYIVVSADHGHMMFPEILPGDIVEEPVGIWIKRKRRCRLGTGLASGSGTVTFKGEHLGIKENVEDICLPAGYKVFAGGLGYFHGGLSLPEAVLPVVVLRAAGEREICTGKPKIEVRYRSDQFTSRVIGLQLYLEGNIFKKTEQVLIEVYDGKGAKAKLVGEAADCEARNERTREVTLLADKETPVPVLIGPDFDGSVVEIRVSDPQTRVVWAKKELKNAILD